MYKKGYAKKILALVLCFSLLFSTAPAFAATSDVKPSMQEQCPVWSGEETITFEFNKGSGDYEIVALDYVDIDYHSNWTGDSSVSLGADEGFVVDFEAGKVSLIVDEVMGLYVPFADSIHKIYFTFIDASGNRVELESEFVYEEPTHIVDLTKRASTIIGSTEMKNLVEINKEKVVIIKASEKIEYIFSKDELKLIDGKTKYDFGTSLSTNYNDVKNKSFASSYFSFSINCNDTDFPADMAFISFPIDKKWVGKKIYYYSIGVNGKYTEWPGYYTVASDSTYIMLIRDFSDAVGVTKELKASAQKVSSLKVKATTSNSMALTWKKQSNIDGYKIFQLKSGKYKLIKTISNANSNSFTVKNLTAGKGYTFKVCAYSNGINGTATVVKAPTKPVKTAITGLTTGKAKHYVKATWKKKTCTGYQVQLATNSKFTKNKKTYKITSYKTVSKKITNLKKGTKYYVKVRPYKTYGGKTVYGAWSSYKSIKCK